MEHGCGQQQITVQHRIQITEKITDLCHMQCMLQQSAYKSMVHTFCRGMELKTFCKVRILEKGFCQLLKIWMFHLIDICQKFLIHLLNIILADRQIICRIHITFCHFFYSFHIQLQRTLKTGHVAHDINIIQRIKLLDTIRRYIPDFCVQCTCFILKCQRIIRLSCFCHSSLFVSAQIYLTDSLAFT